MRLTWLVVWPPPFNLRSLLAVQGDIVQAEGDGANTITFVLGGAVGLFSWEKGRCVA